MKKLEEMNLVDDFLMNSLISHKIYGEKASRYLLECILSKKIGKLMVVPQRFFPGVNPESHGVRLDIYLDEENGWTVYTADGMPSAQWEVTVAVTEDFVAELGISCKHSSVRLGESLRLMQAPLRITTQIYSSAGSPVKLCCGRLAMKHPSIYRRAEQSEMALEDASVNWRLKYIDVRSTCIVLFLEQS